MTSHAILGSEDEGVKATLSTRSTFVSAASFSLKPRITILVAGLDRV